MIQWKALKWLSHTGWFTPVGAILWLVKEFVGSDQLPPALQTIFSVVTAHPYLFGSALPGWSVLCLTGWLYADYREKIGALAPPVVRLFCPAHSLQPQNFDLAKYHDFYLKKDEYHSAKQLLQEKGRLLVLGRPTGGKTRMAFELAKELRGYWVLRVTPDFNDWKKLTLPYLPWPLKLKVVWFLDDLDKHKGKTSLDAGEQALKSHCRLRVLATCRKGEELEEAREDKELSAFIDSLEQVTCSDLDREEWTELAKQTGHDPGKEKFDGTPGSVVLGLTAMRLRLEKSKAVARETMRGVFLLRTVEIYDPGETLLREMVKGIYIKNLNASDFDSSVDWLIGNGFLRRGGPRLLPTHDVYASLEFFDYYARNDPALQSHIEQVGSVVETHGGLEELHSLGIYWGLREQHNLALRFFQTANTWPTKEKGFVFYHNLGTTLSRSGQFDEAIATYQKALKLRPALPATLYNLGTALSRSGQFDEAIATYQKSLDLRPDDPDTLNNLGTAFLKNNQLNDAIAAFQKSLELHPEDPETLNNLGTTLGDKGQFGEAIAAFQKSLELRPDHPNTLYNLGTTLSENNQFDEAITTYRKSLDLRPDDSNTLYNLGIALSNNNQLDEAIAAFRKSLDLRPDHPATLNNLGITLSNNNQLDEAIATYQKSLELRPDHPNTIYNLTLTMVKAGREDEIPPEALELLKKAAAAKQEAEEKGEE